jgi:hypothetical protein
LPPPNQATAWIIPILGQVKLEGTPTSAWKTVAEELLKDPMLAGYSIYFAPHQDDLEMLGLALFPVLIELDDKRNVISAKMGDACPVKN